MLVHLRHHLPVRKERAGLDEQNGSSGLKLHRFGGVEGAADVRFGSEFGSRDTEHVVFTQLAPVFERWVGNGLASVRSTPGALLDVSRMGDETIGLCAAR